jgi:hypothetical protein
VGKIVLCISAVIGLALASTAAFSAPPVLRVIVVQTNDLKTYRHEVETLQTDFNKAGLSVKLRVWRATYAGPDTGTIVVSVEVPDLATLAKVEQAASQPNSSIGAPMHRIEGIRKIVSDSIYEELTP